MANIGKNIRTLRKQKSMTQDDLAALLYVSRQTVSNYETGKSNPDIDMLVKIAEVLESDVNVLIFGIPVPLSRKKEYIKFFGAVFLLFLLSVCYLWFAGLSEKWRRDMFDLGPFFALQMLWRPGIYLLCGWTAMQAVSLLWEIKKQKRKAVRAVYYAVAAGLAVYLFLAVPFCAERLMISWYLPRTADHSTIPQYLPEWWTSLSIYMWIFVRKCPLLFLSAGIILWNGNSIQARIWNFGLWK